MAQLFLLQKTLPKSQQNIFLSIVVLKSISKGGNYPDKILLKYTKQAHHYDTKQQNHSLFYQPIDQ